MILILFWMGCAAKEPSAQQPAAPPKPEVKAADSSVPKQRAPEESDPNARPLRVLFDGIVVPSQVDLVCGQKRYRVRLQNREAYFQAVVGESCLLRAKPMGTTAQIQLKSEIACTLQEGGVTMTCR